MKETMTVIVTDRSRDTLSHVGTRTVEISVNCTVCGKRRGRPQMRRYHEDGADYYVHRWFNDCGHLDTYPDVLAEADQLRASKYALREVNDRAAFPLQARFRRGRVTHDAKYRRSGDGLNGEGTAPFLIALCGKRGFVADRDENKPRMDCAECSRKANPISNQSTFP